MRAIIASVEPHGWHIAMHLGGHGVLEQYEFIASIEAAVVIDHVGRIDVSEGRYGETFSALHRFSG